MVLTFFYFVLKSYVYINVAVLTIPFMELSKVSGLLKLPEKVNDQISIHVVTKQIRVIKKPPGPITLLENRCSN